jgi:hypothetical protein
MPRMQSTGDEQAPLDEHTKRIFGALMAVPFPGRGQIARQVAVARCRKIDAEGSLALRATDAPWADVVRRIPVEAEVEDLDGVTIHVLLHVIDGYIDELEIFREDSAALQAPIRPEALRVVVL